MTLRFKLAVLISVVQVLILSAFGIYSVNAMHDRLIESAQLKLKSDLNMSRNLIDHIYSGPWSIKDGALYKGDTKINGNFEMVDLIGSQTGDTVTIFQGDQRVSTNVKNTDGQRAVDTRAAEEVIRTVLQEGQTYLGKAQVVGFWNQTAYEPIKDGDGKIIGMLYVGVPNNLYDQTVKKFAYNILLIGIIVIALTILISFLILRQIFGKPIERFIGFAETIAQGNLAKEIEYKSRDELGKLAQSFNQMIVNLKEMVTHINATGDRVSEITYTLVAQADQTAAAAAENASNVNKISATIENVVENVKEVSSEAEEASRQADGGRKNIVLVVDTMEEIEQSVDLAAKSVGSLDQAIHKISQFVQTIEGIADQTNLLALNAAIEAARAGDSGRGFAVVAEEVRKLAENSSRSAKEIRGIIGEVQQQSTQALADMESGREKVSRGGQVVGKVSQSLTSIIELIQELSQKAMEVAATAGQIVGAVQNMSVATEEQTSAMEEVSSSVAQLNKIIVDLNEKIARFKI